VKSTWTCPGKRPVKPDATIQTARIHQRHSPWLPFERNRTVSQSIFDIPLQRLNGEAATLAEHAGQVMLLVNVASKCGLTPQYTGLEQLNTDYADKGLRVLGFPCNDFGAQEPGTEAEIESFCQENYGVSFSMYSKLTINGELRHPLYAHLITARPEASASGSDKLQQTLAQHGLLPKHETDVMWNFEKFLVGRDGTVLARYAPDVTPQDAALLADIDAALAAK
jgi:glutathione peroxidase